MVGGGVCKVIFMSNPTVVLRLGWGFDNENDLWWEKTGLLNMRLSKLAKAKVLL